MIRVMHYRINIRDRKNRPSRPYSIAVLADMHNEVYGSDPERLVRAVQQAGVDAVFSAGDLVQAKLGFCSCDIALRTIEGLISICPVYAVNGNHETRMAEQERYASSREHYDAALGEMGVHVLNNRREDLSFNGMKVSLFGLELERHYYKSRNARLTVDDIRSRIGDPGEGYNILLAHFPKFFRTYAAWGADLTLSGHLHGGIVRLPFLGGVIGPDLELFPHYAKGRYSSAREFAEGTGQMIVSAGLGTHTVNLRINNPAELVILDIS